MSPETAVVIVIGLLWGPTMLWLLFRLARGQTSHKDFGMRDSLSGAAAQGTSAAADLSALVDTYGFWLCESCKSLNRGEARRCYSCRAARDGSAVPAADAPGAAPAPALGAASVTTWKAVGPGRPVTAVTGNEGATVAAGVAVASAVASPVASADPLAEGGELVSVGRAGDRHSPLVPGPSSLDGDPGSSAVASPGVLAQQAASASPREASSSALPVATETAAPMGSVGVVAAATTATPAGLPVPAPAPRAGLAVCPFLGLDGDPSTWFDFPDPNNQCHAVQPDDGTLVASVLRLVGARPSARLLDAETQRSRCLTTAHRECARYLLAMKVLANPAAVDGAAPGDLAQGSADHPGLEELPSVPVAHEQDPPTSPQVSPRADDRGRKVTALGSTAPVTPAPPPTEPAAVALEAKAPETPSTETPAALPVEATEAPSAAPGKARRAPAATAPRAEPAKDPPPQPAEADQATAEAPRPARRSGSAASATTKPDGSAPLRQTGTTGSGSQTRKAAGDQPEATPAVEPDVKQAEPVKKDEVFEAEPSAVDAQQAPATDKAASQPAPKRNKRARTGSSPSGTKKGAASGSVGSKSRKQGSTTSRGSRSSRS